MTLPTRERGERVGMLVDESAQKVRRIRRGADTCKRAGFEIPQVLRHALDNAASVKSAPPEPAIPDFTTDPKTFGKQLAEYQTRVGTYDAEISARQRLADSMSRAVTAASRVATDELLPALKERFDTDAREYVELRHKLSGLDTLSDAANADLTGELVRAWHQRREVGQRMSTVIDALKGLLAFLQEQPRTEHVLAMCAEFPREHAAMLVSDLKTSDAEDVYKRFEVLADAGYTLTFVSSLSEWLDRFHEDSDAG